MATNYEREKQELTRRNFVSLGGWVIFVAGLGGSAALFGRFFLPNVKYGPPSKFSIGKAANYTDGAQTTFIDQKTSIIRHGQNIGAISLVCKHLGCTVAASSTGYDCPCHGSKYDAMGDVTHGPAQVGLDWFGISLMPSGELQVDKGDIRKKEAYYIVK